MPGRNINRTEHFDKFVAAEVKSGRFGNASEMVRKGLRLMGTRKREEQAKSKWLRGAVQEGLDEIERGEGRTYESPDDLDRKMDELEALAGIRRGVADVEAGRVTGLKRFEREFRKKHGLPL